MYFKRVNPIIITADFSNICGVHHMLFAIKSTTSCTYLY